MTTRVQSGNLINHKASNDVLETLVELAFSEVSNPSSSKPISESQISELAQAVCSPDPLAHKRYLNQLLQCGVSVTDLAETICPHSAILLGKNWCDDTRNFAEVTIGTARLQAASIRLFESLPTKSHNGKRAAIICRESQNHTYGATVIAHKLRLLGFSVISWFGLSEIRILNEISRHDLDLVLVSEADQTQCEKVEKLIHQIRDRVNPEAKLILGGAALFHLQTVDILKDCADLISNDLDEITKLTFNTNHSFTDT